MDVVVAAVAEEDSAVSTLQITNIFLQNKIIFNIFFLSGGGGGGRGGGGGFGGRGGGGRGGGGGGFRKFEMGPPDRVIPLGIFDYSCQDDLVCKVQIEDVPYFNAPIYLENKESIGKIDEIFGTLRDYYVSIKLSENMKASSFKHAQKVRGFLIFNGV